MIPNAVGYGFSDLVRDKAWRDKLHRAGFRAVEDPWTHAPVSPAPVDRKVRK